MKALALAIVYVFTFAMQWRPTLKTTVMLIAAVLIAIAIYKSK